MSWSTKLFCNISFNRETFNSKYEVKDKIDEIDKSIRICEEEIRDLVVMTEPSKFYDSTHYDSPYAYIISTLKENIESLHEYTVEKYKLQLLLENWERCHNEDGLAIYPPDDIEDGNSYLCGDFIYSTKYPTTKELMS